MRFFFKKLKGLIAQLLIKVAKADSRARAIDQHIQDHHAELMQRNPEHYIRRWML